MAKRQPREGNGLRRRSPRREPYDRVLIVCEGEETEPHYFSELKDHYRLSNANIAVTRADGTDPVFIVRTAKQLRAKEQKQGDQYDRVYCAFDRDRHANFWTACDQIRQSGLYSARSWPCFEYWLLLHFRYTRAAFTESGNRSPCDNCIRMLKQEDTMHDYAKGTSGAFGRLLDRIDLAKQRAGQTRQDTQATGDDNPSTEVHELVDYLRRMGSRRMGSGLAIKHPQCTDAGLQDLTLKPLRTSLASIAVPQIKGSPRQPGTAQASKFSPGPTPSSAPGFPLCEI